MGSLRCIELEGRADRQKRWKQRLVSRGAILDSNGRSRLSLVT
ncbi:hypothetical protein [Sediminispirochaeta smaragdinae]|nr:hypothetical protein [Sediminispirochaeta smaragdinae]